MKSSQRRVCTWYLWENDKFDFFRGTIKRIWLKYYGNRLELCSQVCAKVMQARNPALDPGDCARTGELFFTTQICEDVSYLHCLNQQIILKETRI